MHQKKSPSLTAKKISDYAISQQGTLLVCFGLVTLVYLFIASNNFFKIIPYLVYDDGLQAKLAKSIASGHWLGDYTPITLAKGIIYPLWLAVLHMLHIPLWVGDALLYILASIATIFAIRTIMVNRWQLLFIYILLLFNPMISPRLYRDSIAPAIVLLTISWVIGMFILVVNPRIKTGAQQFKEAILYTLIGLISLPAWWYLREDYFWLLPFIGTFMAISLVLLLFRYIKRERSRGFIFLFIFLFLIPFLSVFISGSIIARENKQHYGRSVVNDYTSSDFTGAYGALTRISDANRPITVPVSKAMRQQAYNISPLFRTLKNCLEGGQGGCRNFEGVGQYNIPDYEGGWFFWALRLAAQKAGYYKNAQTAESFYEKLAIQINTACDRGKIKCLTQHRSTLAPVLEKRDIKPTINNFKVASLFIYELKSPPQEEGIVDIHNIHVGPIGYDNYSRDKEATADFLQLKYRKDQMTTWAHRKRVVVTKITTIYVWINKLFLPLAVAILIGWTWFLRTYKKHWPVLVIGWVLLLTIILRLGMLAFIQSTAFHAVNSLYLGSCYPLMFLLEGLMVGYLIYAILQYAKDYSIRRQKRTRT